MRIPDITVCASQTTERTGPLVSGDLTQSANAQVLEDQDPASLTDQALPSL